MQSHYPDVKVIQTSQGCPSTEKRKIGFKVKEPGASRGKRIKGKSRS
jgi:hypothetical protein